MYKCTECGCIFDEEDVATWEEDMGEFWGAPCTQTMSGCPRCYSTGYEVYREEDEDEDEWEEDEDEAI